MIDTSKCKTSEELDAAVHYEYLKGKCTQIEKDIDHYSRVLQITKDSLDDKIKQKEKIESQMNEYVDAFPIKEWEVDIE